MTVCSKCGTEYEGRCGPCGRRRTKEWRERNPRKNWSEDKKRRHNEYMKAWIRIRVEEFEEYRKTLFCERCGFADHRALEFHHKDPSEKKFAISYGYRRFPLDRVMAEVAKCEVVCSNCHRIEHYDNLDHNPRPGSKGHVLVTGATD